jgi:Tol biopolymer transport system component
LLKQQDQTMRLHIRKKNQIKSKILFTLIVFLVINRVSGQSQYFGQNKQRNKANNFKVLQSPHFELYNYLNDKAVASEFLMASEKWYKLHQEVFKLSFIKPNPLILYSTHPDFQETTAIGGEIGEGTGGVTEGFRTRVVMPLMYTKRQTDHVLGHELVHAFQYQTMTYGSDSTSLQNIGNLPLFMVEGLAEYMSIGRQDSHTAMWMRDAVVANDIPSINDLINKQYKYFPYRWGQAFWAYVTALYGDDIIRPLFKETAIYGIQAAFMRAFKMDLDTFSAKFKRDMVQAYSDQKKGRDLDPKGKIIASEKTGSEMNVGPAISPNGKYIAYISSKNVISLDIYIVDASSGKTVKKIESTSFGAHVDSYSFIETSGAWSADSKRFAIVVQSKSKNKLVVVDIDKSSKDEFNIAGLESFTNPAWSPDGNTIAVTGLNQGTSDIYLYNIKDKTTVNLTADIYSDIQPVFSPDNKYVYFVTDRGGLSDKLEKEKFKIARIDLLSKKVETMGLFDQGDNMNPQFGSDPNTLFFLSEPDGYRNIYSFNINSSQINKLTNFYTGVSGITMYSPALSVSTESNEIVYNYFFKGDYSIIKASYNSLNPENIEKVIDNTASYLMPGRIQNGADIVQRNLKKTNTRVNVSSSEFKDQKYHPRFKLDYLANSGLGVSTSRFGTGVGGGVTALFSDMLNNNQLMGTLAMNGEIQDFGGQVFYLNQKRPLQFGVSASHIPYTLGGDFGIDTTGTAKLGLNSTPNYYYGEINQRVIRLFLDDVSAFVYRPFSKNTRLEFGASANWYTFNARNYTQNGFIGLNQNGSVFDFIENQNDVTRPQKISAASLGFNGFNLAQIYAAYVGDNTTFGTVAPLNGYRYRFEAAKFVGSTSYNSLLADVRKYEFKKPFTIAGRMMYNGRLNPKNLEILNQLNPIYLGFPWHMHGFWGNALNKHDGRITEEALRGEQMAVGNLELRLPFTGPKKLALIEFNYLPSDLNLFLDAGMIWSAKKPIGEVYTLSAFGQNDFNFKNSAIFTTGISLRVNVLGYLIVEPYLAIPFYNGGKQSMVSGFNFMVPGW